MRTAITFLDFMGAFSKFPIFSTTDIYKVFPLMHRRRLHEWVGRGLLKRVIKGYYVFGNTPVDEGFLYLVANRIYEPSYISLQSALNWYSLIPEFVPQVTSVSTKKTTTLSSGIGNFTYFSVKNPLMFGYDLVPAKDQKYQIKMAYPEKAILDILYLRPNIESNEQFSELRLNIEIYKERIRADVLEQYLGLFSNKSLTKRADNFTEYMKNA